MKLKNELIFICLILFILISVSAVSAEENTTSIISINNTDDYVLSINNDVILTDGNDGSFADLNTKITGDSSTNIVLDKDYTYTSTDSIKDGIVINKDNIVIDGKGHTIDAKGQSRIFYVNGTSVTLKNIIFTNGHAAKTGGAIYNYGDNLRVFNCTFTDNTADSWGGAIYSYPDSLSVFINSTFKNNKANNGGAIATRYFDEYGIKHYIINCTFENNVATNYGGAILVDGKPEFTGRPNHDTAIITGSKFIGNQARYGEAISDYNSAFINITNSIILGNLQNIIDADVKFVYANYNWFGNTADDKSVRPNISKYVEVNKWLYLDVIPHIDTSSVTISINNVYDNQTGKTSTYSTNKLPSLEVKLNTVNATVESNNIKLDHTGKYEADLVLLGEASITANCENIIVSKDIKIGGLSELQVLIRNTDDNSVLKLYKDYIYTPGIDTPNRNIIISGKKNIVIDGNGHTINGLGKTMLFAVDQDATGITFKNMYIINGYSNSNNRYDGAGAYIRGYDTTFNNCTFINNTGNGAGTGGALYIHTSKASVVDCKFIGNAHTFSSGGAISWANSGTAYISNTLFENNTADNRAGAVLLQSDGNIINCTFRSNTAEAAGAILHYGNVNITDSTFISNRALGDDNIDEGNAGGGAVMAGAGTISNSKFINNTAKGGAAVYMTSASAIVDNSIFINNTITGLNGIILSSVKGGTVSNSIFLNNNVNAGKIISSIYGGLKADYNWFGSTDKNYAKHPDWGTAATLTKWLFLNGTDPVYNDETKAFETQLNFYLYDDDTKNVVQFNARELPAIQFMLSGKNVTFTKNITSPEELIKGNMGYRISIGEEGEIVTYYNKGAIIAEYETFKYVFPFNFRIQTSIIVNSTVDISKGETRSLGDYVDPFDDIYIVFLHNAGSVTYRSNDTSIVTVDKQGKVTGVKFGVAEVYISFNGLDVMGNDIYTKSNATVIVNVTKIRTQIVNATSMPTYMNATSSQTNVIFSWKDYKNRSITGGNFEFINNNPGVVSIQASGNNLIIKPITEGIANITINVEGNDEYLSATRTITFEVGRKTPELVADPSELSVKVGKEYWIAGPLKSGDINKLSFISDKPDVATLTYENGNYVVRGLSRGVANITIDFAGDDKYKPAKTYLIVNVLSVETHIAVDSEITIGNATTHGLDAAAVDADGTVVSRLLSYSSNDTSVVTIDEYAVITAVGLGKAKITINFEGRDEYGPSSAEVIVNVAILESNIKVEPEFTVYRGESQLIDAKLFNEEGLLLRSPLSYTSNDTSVVTVNGKGKITSVGEGKAKITINFLGNQTYAPSSAETVVNVILLDTYIDVESELIVLNRDTGSIAAEVYDINNEYVGNNVVFTTNDTSVFNITKFGRYTANGLGKAKVTINFVGKGKYAPSSADVIVTVSILETHIDVGSEVSIYNTESFSLEPMVYDSNNNLIKTPLTYVSNDTNVVSVNGRGVISTVGVGKAKITINYAGTDRYNASSAEVIVTVSQLETYIDVDSELSIFRTDKVSLDAELFDSNNEKLNSNLKYTSNDTRVVTVNNNGEITGIAIGKAKVTINYSGTGKYASSSADVIVNVGVLETHIDVDSEFTINKTDDLSIAAEVYDSNNQLVNAALSYSSNDTSVVTVNNNGVITGVGVGKAKVTINYDGVGKYASSSADATVNVVTVKNEINVGSNVDLHIDESVNLNATLKYDGELTYATNDSSVATVDDSGNVVGHKVGTATITVNYKGNGKFDPDTKYVTVSVSRIPTSIDAGNSYAWQLDEEDNIGATLNPQSAGSLNFTSNNESVVVIDENGKITAVGVGATTIYVSFDGNDKYAPSNKTIEVTVFRDSIPTSIDVNTTLDLFVGDNVDIGAILNPSNAGKLIYNSSDESIVKIDENGKITAIAQGKANITVKFEGNNKYLPNNTQVTVSVSIIKTSIDAEKSINVNLTESADLDYVFSHPEAGDLEFKFTDSGIAHVENGKIIGDKVGKTNLTISFKGNERYAPSNATVEVTVSDVEVKIISDDSLNVNVTEDAVIVASLDPRNAGKLTFTSNDSSIVTVDANGKVHGVKVGTAIVTVSFDGNGKYRAVSKNVTVVVSDVEAKIISDDSVNVNVTEDVVIVASLDPRNAGKLKFSTNDKDIISVDEIGKVHGIKLGTATVTVTFEGNGKYRAVSKNVTVVVGDVETTINSADSVNVNVTENTVIVASLDPKRAGKLKYASNDTSIVTVDAYGKVHGVKVGTATVTVTFEGNGKYRAVSKNVTVVVGDVETKINSADSIEVNATESATIVATLDPKDAGRLTFTSNDTSIVSVDTLGNIRGVKVGVATVIITFNGNGKYHASTKNVTVIVSDVETNINSLDLITVNKTEEAAIVATLDPKEAGKLKFSTNDKDIISIDAKGTVYGIKAGTATVTVTFEGNGKYRAASKNVTVVVTEVETTIDAEDSINIFVGESATISATLNPQEAGRLVFTSNDTSIVTVNSRGIINGKKIGTATITVSFADKYGKYLPSTKNITVTVSKVEPVIKVDVDDIDMVYGEQTNINASLNPNVGNLIFSSNDTSVVTVDSEGNLNAVKPGVAAITISYGGDDKYDSINKTIIVNVDRAPSSIKINDTIKMEIAVISRINMDLTPASIRNDLIFTTEDTEIIEIQSGNSIYPLTAGRAVVNILFPGNEYYLPSNATTTIIIDARETKITVNDTVVIGFSESKDLGAVLLAVSGNVPLIGKLKFESTNPEIVSVDKDGKITAHKIGNAQIKITYDGENSFKSANATVDVEVTTKTTNVKIDMPDQFLKVDDTATIVATLTGGPDDYILNYISSDSNVVRINPFTGAITALAEGTATVTVMYPGDDEYHSSSANITVTVSRYTTHINAANSYSLIVYETLDMYAVVTPNEGNLKYTSSDESVVTVSGGVLSGKKSGSAVVTIRFEGDRKYLPVQKEVIVSVGKIPTSINLTDIHLNAGDELILGKIVNPDGAPTRARYYEYISMDTEIFDVDNGVITTFQDGVSELYVEFKGDDVYLPSNKSVTVTVVKKVLEPGEYNVTVDVDDDAGQATFTFELPEDAEGSFIVVINGQVYGEVVEDGKAVVVVDELMPGDYTAALRYGGDIKYSSLENTTKFHIGRYKIDKNKDIEVYLGNTATYTVHLTKDTQAMENKTITFKVNGKKYTAVTDMLGYASVKVKLPASKAYTITAQYGSVKVSNKIKVHVIVAKNLKTKKTKNLKVKVTLKKVNNKYLSNKKVTLKFKGKTYTGKTNSKGVVSFTLNKKVFSKLTIGKSYNYVVKYAKDSVTKTIKITK